jgi:hypothetical protein
MDKTIIYYTANRENEEFEEKIRQRLSDVCGDIPIISVSHKPVHLGKNICIGVHAPSNVLLYYQILLGCKEAKTPFIINAEADFLYPKEYFSFTPPSLDKIYRYIPIELMYKYHNGFWFKKYSEGAQIAGREYLISLLTERLKGLEIFDDNPSYNKFNAYKHIPFETYGGKTACVTFKTGDSLHKYTAVEHKHSVPEIFHWGKASDLRKEIFNF